MCLITLGVTHESAVEVDGSHFWPESPAEEVTEAAVTSQVLDGRLVDAAAKYPHVESDDVRPEKPRQSDATESAAAARHQPQGQASVDVPLQQGIQEDQRGRPR